jgi:tetratricopeptide (TPR) repeat protein
VAKPARAAAGAPDTGRTERGAPRAGSVSTLALALGCVLVLGMALFGHPVGDYHAESDFYGGYAAGARGIEHGHFDPGAYPVVGPVYELTLALIGFAVRDLFLAAKLLSALAACAALGFWCVLLRRRVGAVAALWGTALLAANPIFLRYAYSASTDMLAVAWWSAALFALAGMRGSRAPFVAGLFAALAALTRYSCAVLLPAGALALFLWPREGALRRAQVVAFVGGFALLVLPWTLLALARGHVPGEPLLRYFSFYANPSSDRSVQDLGPAVADSARAYRSLGELLRRDPVALAGQMLGNIPRHLALDARDMLGWRVSILAALGVVLAVARRSGRALAPVWLSGAALFLALAPVFHSERYGLALIPVELSLAAVALALPLPLIGLVVGLMTVGAEAADSANYQRALRAQLPTEVIGAARALAAAAGPHSHVMSRKGHIGWYANVPVVPLPRVATLGELGASARANHADFLYYSWYEAELRPEFAYLLDTTSHVPGLEVVHATERKPSVLYRIGPGFGAEPAWSADDYERNLHLSRALVDVLPESLVWSHRTVLAVDALERGRPDVALALANDALKVRENQPLAWEVKAQALERTGHLDDAIAAYRRSVALAPDDIETQVWLGWALAKRGANPEAASVWRPTVSRTGNLDALRAMEPVFAKLGDSATAAAVRGAIARLGAARAPASSVAPARAGAPAPSSRPAP